jgi:2-methylcitrate dehydratase PrpD
LFLKILSVKDDKVNMPALDNTRGLTATLATYVDATAFSDLPESAKHASCRALVNIIGCCLGGSQHEIVNASARALMPMSGAPIATVIGRAERTDVLTAALLNGLSSAANSFDDTHSQALVHPSGAIASSLLALAEQQPMTGEEFLLAFALGVEIACRISKTVSVSPAKSDIGWSQTGIAAGVGAAVAASKALKLDPRRTSWAIGIAATQASGFRAAHGSMTATLIFGHAARTGLQAAILAANGFDGPLAPLEDRYGYFQLFSATPHTDYLTNGLGDSFEVEALTFKPYPCGAVIHPAVDAAIEWHRSQSHEPAALIEKVVLCMNPSAMALGFRRHPTSVLEAKVSLFHWVAVALMYGQASLSEGQIQVVNDVRIADLREIIQVESDEGIAADSAILRISTKSGEQDSVDINHCKGSIINAMSDEDITEKFYGQALLSLPRDAAQKVCERCWNMEHLEDVAEVVRSTQTSKTA